MEHATIMMWDPKELGIFEIHLCCWQGCMVDEGYRFRKRQFVMGREDII